MDEPDRKTLKILFDATSEWTPLSQLQAALGRDARAVDAVAAAGLVEIRAERVGSRGPQRRSVRLTRAGIVAALGAS